MNPRQPPVNPNQSNRTRTQGSRRSTMYLGLSSIKWLVAVGLFLASAVVAQDSASSTSTAATDTTSSAPASSSTSPTVIAITFNPLPDQIVACGAVNITWVIAPEALNQFPDFRTANIQIGVTNVGVSQSSTPSVLQPTAAANPTTMGLGLVRRDLHQGEFEMRPRLIPRQDTSNAIDNTITTFQPNSEQGLYTWNPINVPFGSWYVLHARQVTANWMVSSSSQPFYVAQSGDNSCIQQASATSAAEVSPTVSSASTPTFTSGQEASASASDSSSSLSKGAKAGIAVGVVVGVLGLAALILVLCRRRNVALRQANRSRRLSGGAMTEKEGTSGTGILAALGVKNHQASDPESTAGNEGFTVLRGNSVKVSRLSKIGAGATRNSTFSSSDEKATGTEQVEHSTLLGGVASPMGSNSSLRKGSGSSSQELGVGSDPLPTLPASSPTPRVHPFANRPPSRPPTWDRASTLIELFDDSVPVSFYDQLQASPSPRQGLLQDAQSPNLPTSSISPEPTPSQITSPPPAPIVRRGSSTSRRKPAPDLPPDFHSVVTTSSSAPAEASPLATTDHGEIIAHDPSSSTSPRQRSVSHGHFSHGRTGHLAPPVSAGSILAAAHQAGSVFTGSKSSLASSVNTQAASLMRSSSSGARNSTGHVARPASEGVPDISSFAGVKEGPVHYLIPDAPEPRMSMSSGGHSDDAVHAELVSHLNRRHSQQSRIRKASASAS